MANGAFKFKDNSGNVVSFISGSGSDIVISGGTLNLSGMSGLTLGNITMSGTTQNAISASQAVSSSYPFFKSGSSILTFNTVNNGADNSFLAGSNAGYQATGSWTLVGIGPEAGYQAYASEDVVSIGYQAGKGAERNRNSVFIGNEAGLNSKIDGSNSYGKIFIGLSAGYESQAVNAQFIGYNAGLYANGSESNYIGILAGNRAYNASGSNFLGANVGAYQSSSAYSNFIGYNIANANVGDPAARQILDRNNIIIGTSLTLPGGRKDSINIGGILFGTGSYFPSGNPYSLPFSGSAGGKIGINVVNPQYNLDVSGSGNYNDGLTVTGSLKVTGFIETQELRTTFISSSILYRSGSTKFGDELGDTHSFTGSLSVSGSISVPGSNLISGSAQVDVMSTTNIARLATTGSNIFTSNQVVTGSISSTGNIAAGTTFNWNGGIGALSYGTGVVTLETNTANAIELKTNGTSAITISTGQTATFANNIGLGVTPLTKLHLQGSSPNYILLTNTAADGVQNAIQGGIIGQSRGYSNNLSQMASILFRNENSAAWYKGEITFNTNGSDGTNPAVSPTERLRITSGGNIGAGTSEPLVRLQVVGANSAEGQIYVGNTDVTYSAGINFYTSSSNRGFVGWRHTNSGAPFSLTGIHLFNTDNSNIVFGTNNTVKAVINVDGNLGINTTTPTQKLHVAGYIRTNGISVFKTGGSISGFIGHEQDWFGTGASNNLICASEGGNEFKVFTNGGTAERITATTGGYVYLGKGWGASNHRINLEVAQGNNILVVSAYAGASNDSVLIRAASGANPNDAGTVMAVTTNSSTGRSISAGGTINASGNDYAEYMLKATTDTINKGDIVGVNIDGKLTNIFNEAISFVVKSTDPSYVGGDAWGTVVGKRPERTTDQTEEEFAPILAEFEAKLEVERQKVDRIAFSGQVPVNVTGATVGDYIIPIETEDGKITGQAITNPSFDQYKISVGKVWKIMEDGRAFIAIKIG